MSKPFQTKSRQKLDLFGISSKTSTDCNSDRPLELILPCILLRTLQKSKVLSFGCALADAASKVLE